MFYDLHSTDMRLFTKMSTVHGLLKLVISHNSDAQSVQIDHRYLFSPKKQQNKQTKPTLLTDMKSI